MMLKTNGFITVELKMNKKDTSRVFCPLRGAEELDPVFEKLTALCKELGTETMIVVDYDVQKRAIVCDVYEDLENEVVLAEDVSLSKAQCILEKMIKERKEAAYRKKVFAEAVEIAANKCAKYFHVRKVKEDTSGEECDYTLFIENIEGDVYYRNRKGWYFLILDLNTEEWKREYLEVGGDEK